MGKGAQGYKKEWEKGPDGFYWSYTDEPHASRRKLILQKYPEIKKLYGYCPKTKYKTTFLVTLQTLIALFVAPKVSFVTFFLIAYVIGGTSNHMLMLAMHELSHNLGFKKILHNKIFGLFANFPVGVPSSVTFKRYHMEHHRYQGEDGVDVDIPTEIEGKIVNNIFTKTLFCILQVFFYALRPVLVNPKTPGKWEVANYVSCISFNTTIYVLGGPSALAYLLLSTLLGAGLHPMAGHFISEHYVFVKGAETYSYYGILNIFAFNVGYHNEHHDFPYVPGSRLPRVREIAPEFYNDLPQCDSWPGIIWKYITDPSVSAFSRIKRHRLDADELKKLKSS